MPELPSTLAPSFVRALPASSRPLAELIERLRAPSDRGLAFALHETTAAARPYLLAGIHGALGGVLLVVVPTADVAERTFADLTTYLGESEPRTVALVRARDEAVGALDSPSERSARMTLLADLCEGRSQIVVAPVAALRQYVMPPERFRAETLTLTAGGEPGWDALQARLYRLGYNRVDVVSAAGEFAVRGGILDVVSGNGRTSGATRVLRRYARVDSAVRDRLATLGGQPREHHDRAVARDSARRRVARERRAARRTANRT